MKKNWLKKSKVGLLKKSLALAVVAGLVSGVYTTSVMAKEYDAPITGLYDYDTVYDEDGIMSDTVVGEKEYVTYTFNSDTTINCKGEPAIGNSADVLDGNILIENTGHLLTIRNDRAGVYLLNGCDYIINSDMDIIVKNSSWSAAGLALSREGASQGYATSLVVNGNVKMRDDSNPDVPWGIKTGNIYGGGVGTITENYKGARWEPAGIEVSMTGGSVITVNGDVDLAVYGTGVSTDPYYNTDDWGAAYEDKKTAIINLNGNVKIETPRNQNDTFYSVANYGGTININTKDGVSQNHDVDMIGNMIVMKDNGNGGPFFFRSGEINLSLDKATSIWHGIVDNSGVDQAGDLNLQLSNGGTWNHESMSQKDGMDVTTMPDPSNKMYGIYDGISHVTSLRGGSSAAQAGYVLQNDVAKIDVQNYSGNTVFVYKHDNGAATKFAGGDLVINHAAAGSGIVLSTDNTGIAMDDETMVFEALNNLAGKLYYKGFIGGEDNLAGKVQIASGLTASNAALKSTGIWYDGVSGQGNAEELGGGTEPENPDQPNVPGKDEIVREDLQLNVNGSFAGVQAVDKDININSTRTVSFSNANVEQPAGIVAMNDSKLNIKANMVQVNVKHETKGGAGIWVAGPKAEVNVDANLNVNVTSEADKVTYGIAVKNGGKAQLKNVNIKVLGVSDEVNGILLDKDAQSLRVSGNANIKANKGILVYAKDGLVDFDGNVDLAIEAPVVTFAAGGAADYALVAEGPGKIAIDSQKLVNIKGNVKVSEVAGVKGDIHMELQGKESSFEGIVYNADGNMKLGLGQRAKWINNSVGAAEAGFTGSVINEFVGGDSTSRGGYIFQKDANPLTINNYSGFGRVVYDHINDGDEVTDYAAGNTIVKEAAVGSNIIVATSNDGIDMTSEEAIEKAFKALSQKLVYEADNKKLYAKVEIASGLTSSYAAEKRGDMKFDDEGKGYYVDGTITSVDDGEIEYGNFESCMMEGVRTAMMNSMLDWRDNAADISGRANALRDGAEEGIWARTFGGKTNYSGSADFSNSYWGAQVGYDRQIKNGWNVGAAIDYRDGSGDYLLGGEGDNLLYSFDVYGTKEIGDNAYIDIAIKSGRAENEFTVFNEIGTRLEGEYGARGYSASVQYSKKFGKTERAYFEPQLQLTWARLQGTSYNAFSGSQAMKIDQNAFESLVGRIGLEAGKKKGDSNIFARLSIAHEFSGDVEGSYFAVDGGLKTTQYDVEDTWSEFTLGADFGLNANGRIYADLTKTITGDYEKDWRINAGLKLTF